MSDYKEKKKAKKMGASSEEEDMGIEITSQVEIQNNTVEKRKQEARKTALELSKKENNKIRYIVTSSGEVKSEKQLTKKEQSEEYIKCALDPIYFIETYLTIFDQTQGDGGMIVPFKLFEFQKFVIKNYQAHRFNIANKYRQAGISTTTCAYIAWYIIFNENVTVAVVANKFETARDELMADIIKFIDQCPNYIKPEIDQKDSEKHKIWKGERVLKAFAPNTLRGLTPTLMFWDETAWAEKGEKFWIAARPTFQTGGNVIFVSCVTKDSFIYTDKGIKQINDFVKPNVIGPYHIDEYNVLGINKLRKGNIIHNNGFVNTLKIKTAFNELESSENHKYWAYKNGKYDWIKAEDLEIGDYVSIQYGMNIWGNNDDCSDFKPTESNYIKNKFKPTKITPDLAYLIGLYISEGCGKKRKNKKHNYYGITITCGDSIHNIFKILNINYYTKDNLHYEISGLNVSEFFEYLGFDLSKKAPQKIIPTRLLEMSRENIIAMIQGIMDGDGCSTFDSKKNRLRVTIGLSSKTLIDQLRIIFMNFGILTEYREQLSKPTKRVKVESINYGITANGENAAKYFDEIGFRFERKQTKINLYDKTKLKHIGVRDNIPDGLLWAKKIYKKNNLKIYKEKFDFNIENLIQGRKKLIKSRKSLLKLIEFENDDKLKDEYSGIISPNIVWTKIKTIEKSQNDTYDFSLPNDAIEENDFHHSVIYNGIITHQTPNGLDPVYYATYRDAKLSANKFNPIELHWFNDPRYNQNLVWIKNKGKETELTIVDDNFSHEKRLKLKDDGFEASSPWFEAEKANYNGNHRQLSQELLGSFLGSGSNFIPEEYIKYAEENTVTKILRQEFEDTNMWIWEEPIQNAVYIMGIDVSTGNGEDYSSISILKLHEVIEFKKITNKQGKLVDAKVKRKIVEQVAEYYGKQTPEVIGHMANHYGRKYNNALAVVDITGHVGTGTINKLMESNYPNVYYSEISNKPLKDSLVGYNKIINKEISPGIFADVEVTPGIFITNNRATMLLSLSDFILTKSFIIRSKRLTNELKTFVTVENDAKGRNRLADHRRSFHDDAIWANTLPIYVITYHYNNIDDSVNKQKMMLDAMTKIDSSGNKVKLNEKTPENYVDIRGTNPYLTNSWLFKGLRKK